jgi:hypothetical protein
LLYGLFNKSAKPLRWVITKLASTKLMRNSGIFNLKTPRLLAQALLKSDGLYERKKAGYNQSKQGTVVPVPKEG